MAEFITTDTGKMQESFSQLKNCLDKLNGLIDQMNGEVRKSEGMWVGDTGTAFRAKFEQACGKFKTTVDDTLTQYATKMQRSVSAQHEQDTQLGSKISGLNY
ncbi:MAG: WXG100 family type VII secretion target [Clostridiales bacterium]|jgi:uncharacterized protein YukE|nr:WXG100 family type VII secretion target [Clostridiales bacterium]